MNTESRNIRRRGRPLLGLSVVLCVWFMMSGDAQAMLYRPEQGKPMWDPGVFWHDGTYYMFAMYGEGTRWPDGRGLQM